MVTSGDRVRHVLLLVIKVCLSQLNYGLEYFVIKIKCQWSPSPHSFFMTIYDFSVADKLSVRLQLSACSHGKTYHERYCAFVTCLLQQTLRSFHDVPVKWSSLHG